MDELFNFICSLFDSLSDFGSWASIISLFVGLFAFYKAATIYEKYKNRVYIKDHLRKIHRYQTQLKAIVSDAGNDDVQFWSEVEKAIDACDYLLSRADQELTEKIKKFTNKYRSTVNAHNNTHVADFDVDKAKRCLWSFEVLVESITTHIEDDGRWEK